MKRQILRQHDPLQAQDGDRALDIARQADKFAGRVWLRQWEAAEHTGRPNVRAFYCWRDRHGIVAVKGLVAKRDLDRVLSLKRKAR